MHISKKAYKNVSDKIKGLPESVKEVLVNKNKKNIEEIPEDTKKLLENIRKTQKEWAMANINFEFASDIDLIDCCIYEIKAHEAKYEYLIRKAKEKGITAEMLGNRINSINNF